MLVYAPASVQEAVDLTYKAFEKAEGYSYPVMIAIDGVVGSMMEAIELPEMKTVTEKEFVPIGRMPTNRGNRVTTSCLQDPEPMELVNIKAAEMYEKWNQEEVLVEEYMLEDAEIVIAAYGISGRISKNAVDVLRKEGKKVGLIRPITINPFPFKSFEHLDYSKVKHIIDIEMSIPAQMIDDVKLGVMGRAKVSSFGRSAGVMMNLEEVIVAIRKVIEEA